MGALTAPSGVRRKRRPSALGLLGLLAALLCAFSCSGNRAAEAVVSGPSERRPLVLVPGVTGASLRDVASGKVIWGRGNDLLFPRDGGYAVARPLSTDDTGDSGAEVVGVIQEIRVLGVIRRKIYRPLRERLEGDGYRSGNLASPTPEADYYQFAYDWRDDLVASTRRLHELLEGVRAARGVPTLEVDLICQSAGGQICRYLAKYGGASLDAAESGEAGPSPTVRVAKAVLVGTANGGASRIVRELDRGRRYVGLGLGRKMEPEVLFTFPSLFQDLPVYRDDLFVDTEGRPAGLDLFDAETWVDNELSIFAPESRKRIERRGRADLFGDEAQRRRSLERFLDRGRRLHEVLARDVDGFDSRYYSVQNVDKATPDRIVVRRAGEGRAELLFTGDKALDSLEELNAAVSTGGDGHATVASQLWLSAQERAAMAAEPFHIEGDHFKMILDPRTETRILEFLADDAE